VTHLQSHTQVCRDASWHPYFPEIISCSWDGTLSRWTRADEEYAETETLLNNFLYHTIPSTLRRSSRLADQARILASTLSDVVHYIGDAQNE
jgi:WD40 repeat protein